MISHRNILKDLGRILFWYPVKWTVRTLSFEAVYKLGTLLGDIDYIISGRARIDRMKKNISRVFTNSSDCVQILRANLRNHIRTTMEFIKYTQLNKNNIENIVSFENIEHLENALNKEKGVILATSHFGAKQLLQPALGHNGYKLTQIHYHKSSEELSFIQKNVAQRNRIAIEDKIPCHFISAKGFMRQAFRCLKNNEVLIIAADGSGIEDHIDSTYRPFDFLGKKMMFPTNMIELSKRTGAAIVPVFVQREATKHRIVFEPPLTQQNDTIEQYVAILEKHIRQSPHLWEFWEEFEPGHLIIDKQSITP